MSDAIEITWSQPTGSALIGQRIYRSSTDSPTYPDDFSQIAVVPISDERYRDPDGSNTDTYAVTVINETGESDPLLISSISPPEPPSALTAEVQ